MKATSQHAKGSCSFYPKGEQEATGEKYLPQSSPMKSRCLYILNMAKVQSVTRNRRCLVPIDHKCGIGFSSVFDTVFRYCICQFFLRYCGIEYFLKVPHLRKANMLTHRGTAEGFARLKIYPAAGSWFLKILPPNRLQKLSSKKPIQKIGIPAYCSLLLLFFPSTLILFFRLFSLLVWFSSL